MACQRCFNSRDVESMRLSELPEEQMLQLCKRCRWELGKLLDFLHFYSLTLIPRAVLLKMDKEAVNGTSEAEWVNETRKVAEKGS